jgi:DNA-binding beta-propeller fold protein YncE
MLAQHLTNVNVTCAHARALVPTLAGSLPVGSAASFLTPAGVTVDVSGNVYVADETNQQIRKITPTP